MIGGHNETFISCYKPNNDHSLNTSYLKTTFYIVFAHKKTKTFILIRLGYCICFLVYTVIHGLLKSTTA